jgi:hypothetical protein
MQKKKEEGFMRNCVCSKNREEGNWEGFTG